MRGPCPTEEALAAAVTGEADAALAHATTCARCAEILDGQRDIHASLAALRAPARMPPARRAELAASLLAHADRLPAPAARHGRTGAIALALAAAAAATIVLARPRPVPVPVPLVPVSAPVPATPPPSPPAPPPTPVPIPAPKQLPPHRVRVATAPAPHGALPDAGAGAFRIGWTRLHAGDFAGATDAFDHATDPVIADEAAYWAAMAADRAGDRAGAIRRFTALVARFPDSARADDARTQLARR